MSRCYTRLVKHKKLKQKLPAKKKKKKKRSGTTLNDRVKTCMVPNTLRLAVKGYLIHANFLIPLLLKYSNKLIEHLFSLL